MNPEQLTSMIAKPYRHVAEFGYDFCNGLLLAWVSSGFDAQLEFDVETDRGADSWALWWINGGRNNFPGISSEVDRAILRVMHLNHLDATAASQRLPITPLLSLIYRTGVICENSLMFVFPTESISSGFGGCIPAGNSISKNTFVRPIG